MKLVIFFSAVFIQLLAFSRWLSCKHFHDFFYFTPEVMNIRLYNAITDHVGITPTITRIFNNKIESLFWGVSKTLLQYWDIRFLESFLGLIGVFGVILFFWFFVTKSLHKKYFGFSIFAISILALFHVIFKPITLFPLSILLFGILFQSMSLFGIWEFLKPQTRSRYLFITVVIVLSLFTFLTAPLSYHLFCAVR